jgi:alpha-methylacyl-CoA racemase
MTGPLAGIRIVELGGIGPGPFACTMLADHGAEVIRVERPGWGDAEDPALKDVLLRSRRVIGVDLKTKEGAALIRDLAATADGVIEGFRPGVTERLGLGQDELLAVQPRLVYGRMTGWGQQGPLSHSAGHDINYIAVAGALNSFGRAGKAPIPPLNLVGDFGGGGMMLAFAMVSAILHARSTGQGQVIDCAITDGTAMLMAGIWGLRAQGRWQDARGVNLLDTGEPFYDVYATADDGHICIGAIEPKFYDRLRDLVGVADDPAYDRPDLGDRAQLRDAWRRLFRLRSRDEWSALLEGTDACFAPVLGMDEARAHPHNVARGTFIDVDGVVQPAPAPSYSRTKNDPPTMPSGATATDSLMAELGYSAARRVALRQAGVVT